MRQRGQGDAVEQQRRDISKQQKVFELYRDAKQLMAASKPISDR